MISCSAGSSLGRGEQAQGWPWPAEWGARLTDVSENFKFVHFSLKTIIAIYKINEQFTTMQCDNKKSILNFDCL